MGLFELGGLGLVVLLMIPAICSYSSGSFQLQLSVGVRDEMRARQLERGKVEESTRPVRHQHLGVSGSGGGEAQRRRLGRNCALPAP